MHIAVVLLGLLVVHSAAAQNDTISIVVTSAEFPSTPVAPLTTTTTTATTTHQDDDQDTETEEDEEDEKDGKADATLNEINLRLQQHDQQQRLDNIHELQLAVEQQQLMRRQTEVTEQLRLLQLNVSAAIEQLARQLNAALRLASNGFGEFWFDTV